MDENKNILQILTIRFQQNSTLKGINKASLRYSQLVSTKLYSQRQKERLHILGLSTRTAQAMAAERARTLGAYRQTKGIHFLIDFASFQGSM